MNRQLLHALADERAAEAKALVNAGLWSGAYYLAGYAVECGLKACVLVRVLATGGEMIFGDRKFSADCFTHDPVKLLALAGLTAAFDTDSKANLSLYAKWSLVLPWRETARYKHWTETEARDLVEAVTHPTDGVLTWIKVRW